MNKHFFVPAFARIEKLTKTLRTSGVLEKDYKKE
tara:strand:- start:21 stop:122 length:102 start_codon:yes stop_codon:yes gene_type:complete